MNIIFDFDFTIAKTVENIWVWSPRGCNVHDGKRYYPMHPQELSNSGIGDDETIDDDSFKEFYSINTSRAKSIIPVIKDIIYYTEIKNYEVIILTARPQRVEDEVFYILKNNNVNTNKINFVGLTNSKAQAKIDYIINNILTNKTDDIIIYEDSSSVIDLAIKNFPNLKYVQVSNTGRSSVLNYNNF
jgi:hypothetical protein